MGQRAEDERDGANVGLDEADTRRGERFAGDETGGAGVGARTAARTGGGTAEADGSETAATVPAAASGPGAGDARPAVERASVPAAGPGTESRPESESGSRFEPMADSKAELKSESGDATVRTAKAGDRPRPGSDQLPPDLTDSQILGRRLALARQHAGLSIEEVAAATRIRPGMVREIEAGYFLHCGGDVYARGHVRAISKCVGLDAEPLIAAHPPVVPTELPARPRARIVARPETPGGKPAQDPDGADRPDSPQRPDAAAAVQEVARDNAARFAARAPSRVIRPAAEGATFRINTGGTTPAAPGPASGSVRPPQPGRKDDPGKIERQPKSANWTAAMLVALLGLVVFAGVQLLGGDTDKHAPAATPVPAPKPALAQPPPAPAPPPKDVEVRIAAVGADSWLNVTGNDGRVLFDNLLPAGGTQSFKDAKELGITLGNASAVHMNLNGKDLGSAGGQGQVVHWTLNPTGAVNN